jgi:DNA ligase-1
MPTKTLRREFLQLADTYNPKKHKIAGFYISEKLDGTRCFWDGGLTRGMRTEDVPWASVIDPKTGERKAKIKPVSTGLWSRYGNPIVAPDSFLNALPACFLDGELWAGRGKYQLCRSICGGDTPDPRFNKITYAVYSTPAFPHIFQSGEIKNANMVLSVSQQEIEKFVRRREKEFGGDFGWVREGSNFDEELLFLRGAIETQNDAVFLHQQVKLPGDEAAAREAANEYLNKVLDRGGEGCVIRDPNAVWFPKRHKGLLKFKPYEDAEGTVVGFTSGRKTDKGSKLLGKIGALILDFNGKRLELAGLTDEEREFLNLSMSQSAAENPGKDMPAFFQGRYFKVGQTVTFKFRELTDDGIPKEARYWRRREGVE